MDSQFFARFYHGTKLRFGVAGNFQAISGDNLGNMTNRGQLNYGGEDRLSWEMALETGKIGREQATAGCLDRVPLGFFGFQGANA